jgi:hypothetical protein
MKLLSCFVFRPPLKRLNVRHANGARRLAPSAIGNYVHCRVVGFPPTIQLGETVRHLAILDLDTVGANISRVMARLAVSFPCGLWVLSVSTVSLRW